jgi:membrane-bound lytic murein transglycosylase A
VAPVVKAPGPPKGLVSYNLDAERPPQAPVAPDTTGAALTAPEGKTSPESAAPPPGLLAIGTPDWSDDGTSDSLSQAVSQSLAYYRGISPDTPFAVGPLTYTAEELARSLELFQSLRRAAPDAAALAEQLRQKFLVFESIAEQADNLFTGYYEPRIPGSLTPTAYLSAPLYARPPDLVEVALDDFGKDLPKRRVMGRVQDGRLVPYYSREEIQHGGVLEGRTQTIVYVNEIDLFFLQIQGSGQVQLPDGRIVAVGYDSSNGQPYRALGAELIRRNLMARDEVSLFSLRRYLAEHKELAPALLNTNPSYVFFRRLEDGRGPLGNLRVPLTPGRSLAADRTLLPPGVLAYVMTSAPVPSQPGVVQPLHRFQLIQDTGGAIRGHGRGDLFWGEGADAEWIAGHAKQPGRLFILVARKDALPAPEPPVRAVATPAPPQALGRPLQARMP